MGAALARAAAVLREVVAARGSDGHAEPEPPALVCARDCNEPAPLLVCAQVFRSDPPKFEPVPGAADTSAEGAQHATAAQLRAAIGGFGSGKYAVKKLPGGNLLVFQVEDPKWMNVEHGGVFGYNPHALKIRDIAVTVFLVDASGKVSTECKPIGPFQLWFGIGAHIEQWARDIVAHLSDESRPLVDAWNTADWPEDNLFNADNEEREPGTHTAWDRGAWPDYNPWDCSLPEPFWIAPPDPRVPAWVISSS